MWPFDRNKPAPAPARIEPSIRVPRRPRQIGRRDYIAAATDRLRSSWTTVSLSPSEEIRRDRRKLVARSRDSAKNNWMMKRFLGMLERNVPGPTGIILQSLAAGADGKADKEDRATLQKSWKAWGKRGVCTVCGEYSWHDLERMGIRATATDGEFLARKIRGKAAGNKWGFALQVFESDVLDDTYFDELANGNIVENGVEKNHFGRPVAYHLWTRAPSERSVRGIPRERLRIPADEIVHPFMAARFGQARGIPWVHAALDRMKMTDGYEEAEVVAARVAASKMGIFISPDGEPDGDDVDGRGNFLMDADPGSFMTGPEGFKFEAWDPTHPTTQFDPFLNALVRGIASGLDVNYNTLANDLSKVNFSSLRQGALDERDAWRIIQNWYAGQWHDPVFDDWLGMMLVWGAEKLPVTKFEKFRLVRWQGRGWQWVDPQKEITALKQEVRAGITPLREAIIRMGRDPDEVLEQYAETNAELDALDLIFDTDPRRMTAAGAPVSAGADGESNGVNSDDEDDEENDD